MRAKHIAVALFSLFSARLGSEMSRDSGYQFAEIHAQRNPPLFIRLFPTQTGSSSRIDVPDWRVTGAIRIKPAKCPACAKSWKLPTDNRMLKAILIPQGSQWQQGSGLGGSSSSISATCLAMVSG